MVESLFKAFDIWINAQGLKFKGRVKSINNISSEGISRLRELVIQLAIKGKLVGQEPTDEPACVLIKKLKEAKTRLVIEGKIPDQVELNKNDSENFLFELPQGWEWARLGDIAYPQPGFAFKSSHFNQNKTGLPIVRIRDVGDTFSGTYYSGEYRNEFLVNNGDYLISMDGDFRVAPWLNESALLNQRVSRLIFYSELVSKKFIAESLQIRLNNLQGIKAYTTVDHLSGKQIYNALIGLPPIAEQKRIVAKVDELMVLCDRLEEEQLNNLKTHQVLVKTVLETLTQAEDANELQSAWERISRNFNTLFCTEDSINQLQQTILQLAVMGKLVKQDPKDETATALLKKIAKAKEKLIEEGELKKQIKLPPITEQETPYNLPKSWEWCRLGEITLISRGSSPRPKGDVRYFSKIETEYNWITISDITNYCRNNVLYKTREHLTEEGAPLSRYVGKDEFIIAVSGSTTGKCCITGITGYIYDGLASVNFIDKAILNEYFLIYMLQYYKYINTSVEGLFPNINTEFLKMLMISIPPKHEQKRIVNKVNELFELCESLREKNFKIAGDKSDTF